MSIEQKDLQAELCAAVINRLNAQHVKGNKTRTNAALHMLCGAAHVLHAIGSEHYNGVSMVAVLTSARAELRCARN